MEREQREQARQERHAARALATAAALEAAAAAAAGSGELGVVPDPNSDSSPPHHQDPGDQETTGSLHAMDAMISSADLADLLLEVRLGSLSLFQYVSSPSHGPLSYTSHRPRQSVI